MNPYFEYTLSNGMKIIAEQIPHFRSIAFGIWVRTGSVNESTEQNGFSHFIEHMLFKGTEKRTAMDISSAIDQIGGQLNAFTSKECTCFYATVRDEHLETAVDVLSDMLLNAAFDPNEIEKEKGVVIEEIHMVEDTPEDLVHELLAGASFGSHPLGQQILGPEANIRSLNRDRLMAYLQNRYTPDRIVLSFAGRFDTDQLVSLCENYFGTYSSEQSEKSSMAPVVYSAPEHRISKYKDIEQLHLALALPGIGLDDDRIYIMNVLCSILGGGMSSRLFQSLREENGLVYTIYAYPVMYRGIGKLTVYAAMNAAQGVKAAKLIEHELDRMKQDLTDDEVQKAKEQLKGNYILGQESTSSRMSAIGKAKLIRGEVKTEDQILSMIDRITLDDVLALLEEVLKEEGRYLSLVGRIPDADAIARALHVPENE